jgi:uncharacterized protein YndB with AHSA1/START domain
MSPYIRTTSERLWSALTSPEFTKQYWFGMHCESEWKAGSSWQLKFQDGCIADAGEILEAERAKRLVIKWRNEFKPEMRGGFGGLAAYPVEPQIASGDRRSRDEIQNSLTVIDAPRPQSALATRRDALNRSRWSSSRR